MTATSMAAAAAAAAASAAPEAAEEAMRWYAAHKQQAEARALVKARQQKISMLGFYDFVPVCAGWLLQQVLLPQSTSMALVHYAVTLCFLLFQVQDLWRHTEPGGVEWLLRLTHHVCCTCIVGGRDYSLALAFLRTHIYIVLAYAEGKARFSAVGTALCFDEAFVCYLLCLMPGKVAPFAPACVALLAVRPVLLRGALPDKLTPRLQLEFAFRYIIASVSLCVLVFYP
jgi:hypothetical protein